MTFVISCKFQTWNKCLWIFEVQPFFVSGGVLWLWGEEWLLGWRYCWVKLEWFLSTINCNIYAVLHLMLALSALLGKIRVSNSHKNGWRTHDCFSVRLFSTSVWYIKVMLTWTHCALLWHNHADVIPCWCSCAKKCHFPPSLFLLWLLVMKTMGKILSTMQRKFVYRLVGPS